jgi:hypothetical protein
MASFVDATDHVFHGGVDLGRREAEAPVDICGGAEGRPEDRIGAETFLLSVGDYCLDLRVASDGLFAGCCG